MSTEGGHCGSKPKRVAFGIAPLGTVSIGIVPMGVICIGVVPMGVVSIGVVAMGVNADGSRELLGLKVGDSESEPFWSDFIGSLKPKASAKQ